MSQLVFTPVAPTAVLDFWEQVEPGLQEVIDNSENLCTTEQVLGDLLNGTMRLTVGDFKGKYAGFLITELQPVNDGSYWICVPFVYTNPEQIVGLARPDFLRFGLRWLDDMAAALPRGDRVRGVKVFTTRRALAKRLVKNYGFRERFIELVKEG